MHFAAVASCAMTDYISVGFSWSLDMYGDTVDGQGMDMIVHPRIMTGHPTPKSIASSYISNQSMQWVDNLLVMKFSRSLANPGSGSYGAQDLAKNMAMVFALGQGPYKKHYKWWRKSLAYSVSSTFSPDLTPLPTGLLASMIPTIPPTTAAPTTIPTTVDPNARITIPTTVGPTAGPTHASGNLVPQAPIIASLLIGEYIGGYDSTVSIIDSSSVSICILHISFYFFLCSHFFYYFFLKNYSNTPYTFHILLMEIP